jgi:hypothetical protein
VAAVEGAIGILLRGVQRSAANPDFNSNNNNGQTMMKMMTWTSNENSSKAPCKMFKMLKLHRLNIIIYEVGKRNWSIIRGFCLLALFLILTSISIRVFRKSHPTNNKNNSKYIPRSNNLVVGPWTARRLHLEILLGLQRERMCH